MPGTNYVGAHWLRGAQAKSIRQKYQTGPQYFRRKNFSSLNRGQHVMVKKIGAMPNVGGGPTSGRMSSMHRNLFPSQMHKHLAGDVRQAPDEDYYFENRVDKVEAAWKPRGKFQVFHVGGKTETFVCFRCGYPIRSKLQVIKNGNWDWRMCYNCYVSVVQQGMEDRT